MAAHALFQLERLTLGLNGREVLRGINLRIERGEKIAILGESGAGKTTLLRHLRSLQSQDVAWCPQQSGLVPMLSVLHNIYMGRLDQHSVSYNLLNLIRPLAGPRQEISALAAQLGLQEKLFTAVEALSGGQQSRTNLARALYQEKPIFLGDEPVSAVDEVQADHLLTLICSGHDTVVVALHDVELALRHCTRVIGLRNGVIELDQPVSQCTTTTISQLYATN